MGRFLQRDPLGYADGPNVYTYAGSRPTVSTDPLGLEEEPKPEPHPAAEKAIKTMSENGVKKEITDDLEEKNKNGKITEAGSTPGHGSAVRDSGEFKVGTSGFEEVCTCDEYGSLAYALLIATILHENEHANGATHPADADPETTEPSPMTKAVIDQLKAMQNAIDENGNPICPCGCGKQWVFAFDDLGVAIDDEQEYADSGYRKPSPKHPREADEKLKKADRDPNIRGD